MSALMPNIRKIRDDLRESGWHMIGFPFMYKHSSYSVLCENLDNLSKDNSLAIVLLTFIDDDCHERQLRVEANSATFFIDPKTLREYFRISYGKNMGDNLAQFYSHFAPYIPEKIPLTISEEIKVKMVSRLCDRDGDNPNARFCFGIYRNGKDPRSGKQRHRRVFNQDRARLLVPDLYEYFRNDTTISFCFTADQSKELSTHEIIQNYSHRYGR